MDSDKKTTTSSGKRILIITERFYPEEFILNDLVTELKSRGLDFDVLTQEPGYPNGNVSDYTGYKNNFFKVDFWNKIKIYRIMTIQNYSKSKYKRVFNYLNFAILSSIVLLFIGRKYKKIFVFQAGPLTVGIAAIIGKKIFKTTNTIWSVDLWPDTVYMYGFKQSKLNKAILDLFVTTIYNQFDTIFCSSFAFSKRLKHYVNSKPIHTLLQWPQISIDETVECDMILDKEYFNFTFTGNIARTQNLENVILGFSLAQKTNSKIKLNIFGNGSDLERLEKLTHDHSISNVVFWGRKPLIEMPTIYNQSQVLVISLQPDPVYDLYIPLKFSTYIAFSKPIFAIMNGVVSELVETNKIGVSASPSNIEEIGVEFLKLSSMDKNQLDLYSKNSSRLLENEFNRTRNIDIIFNTLKFS